MDGHFEYNRFQIASLPPRHRQTASKQACTLAVVGTLVYISVMVLNHSQISSGPVVGRTELYLYVCSGVTSDRRSV